MGCASCFHVQIGARCASRSPFGDFALTTHFSYLFILMTSLYRITIPAFFREFLWQDRQKEKSESRREERREEVQLMLSSHHCHHPKAETSPMSFQAPPEAEVSAAPAPAPAVVPAPAMAPTRPATVPGCVDLGGACWRQY